MSASAFAALPEPPHYAVVSSSLRRGDDGMARAETAARMAELATRQSGRPGAESVRDAAGFGITISCWRDDAAIAAIAAIAACKRHAEHAVARAMAVQPGTKSSGCAWHGASVPVEAEPGGLPVVPPRRAKIATLAPHGAHLPSR
jgi:hypothetical protein